MLKVTKPATQLDIFGGLGDSLNQKHPPVIGHLKQNYRLCKNYLKGILGDNMNLILAAAARNFKQRMNLWRTEAIIRWLLLYKYFVDVCKNFYAPNFKMTF